MTEETRLLHVGTAERRLHRTVAPPVQRGSTVLMARAAELYDDDLVTYGRQGLAAQEALIEGLCALEGATSVCLYPSGLAALTGAMLALLEAGDEVAVCDTIYKPTRRFCDRVLERYGVKVVYYDPLWSPEEILARTGPRLRLVVLESPGSLSFEMQDMAALASAARARGALTLADNTWGAGYYCKPLELGVDVSVQALTKYVGGHSDAFMGSAAARDPAVGRRLADGVLNMGWAVGAEDAYLMLRGLRTLPTRLARHQSGALKLASWLQDQPLVRQILHPALPMHAGHELWRRQFTGSCGLFGFTLAPDCAPRVEAFLDALELFGLGFSWGGFESLAISCDPQLRARTYRADYGGPLIRLHIGLEDPDDLVADLARGFAVLSAAD